MTTYAVLPEAFPNVIDLDRHTVQLAASTLLSVLDGGSFSVTCDSPRPGSVRFWYSDAAKETLTAASERVPRLRYPW